MSEFIEFIEPMYACMQQAASDSFGQIDSSWSFVSCHVTYGNKLHSIPVSLSIRKLCLTEVGFPPWI